MVRQRSSTVGDGKGDGKGEGDDVKNIMSRPKKEQAVLLKGHSLLQTCSKDKPEMLPKAGEMVWARVHGSVFWPGFILELNDLEWKMDGSDGIDDSAYGFVMFLEKTYRYAPIAWEQMIPFKDMDTQLKLMPHYNKLVVKKNWKPTSIYRTALEMAKEFCTMSLSERLSAAESKYQTVKKTQTPKSIAAPATTLSTPSKPELPPEEAISKVMSAVREKKKSGIRVSDRITKKQIVKLKPKPVPKTTATKKTEETSDEKAATKQNSKHNKNPRPEVGGEVLKQWTMDRFNSFPKQNIFESSSLKCVECNFEISPEEKATCHGMPYHSNCLLKQDDNSPGKCKMCLNKQCFLCKQTGEVKTHKCSRCELRFHIDCLLKDWPQAEIQGSNGPITCPVHFCHTCLGEQKNGKCRDYTTNPSKSYRCKLCLSNYHKTCLPAGCGENVEGKEFIVCPKHTLPELKVYQRRIGCVTCFKPLRPKEEKVECSHCVQAFHPKCVGYDEEAKSNMELDVFALGYKCFFCKWGLYPLYGQVVWFQQPQSQYWPARILYPAEYKSRKSFAKRLPGQYSIEYFGSTLFYDNASRAIPLHLTTVEILKSMKVYQEVPKILRAHEEAAFCCTFAEEHRDKQLPPPKPIYKKIEKNVYRSATVEKQKKQPTDVCSCSEEKTEFVCQADSGCTNRDTEMECNDRTCKGGARCSNRMFSQRKNDDDFLEQKLFPKKGWGVIAKRAFKPGDFVAEYKGEAIEGAEMMWRLEKKVEEDPMYILEISNKIFIDAEYVGNISRLINHSCDPNCDVRKYLSLGRSVGGIFAKRAIEVGEEVTFKYGCGSQSTAPFRCRCGADNCSLFVGKKAPENFMVDDEPEQTQDKWDDVCSKCGYGGRVICCEFPGCRKVWHYHCVGLHRQPRKNWCCPNHPARKVEQFKKTNENKASKSKITNGKAHTNASSTSTSAKPRGPPSQPSTKKKPPHQSGAPLIPPIDTMLTPEEALATAKRYGAGTPLAVPKKRKMSATTSLFETSLQPAQKKQRTASTSTTASKTDEQKLAPAAQELKPFPPPSLLNGRSLRSSRMSIPAKSLEPSVEPPHSPALSMKSEALVVIKKTLETPVIVPSTQPMVEARRRRANSIPANGRYFNLPSTPNTRPKRLCRRGESVNERSPVSKKLDSPSLIRSKEMPLIPDMLETCSAVNQLSCSGQDKIHMMSRRRSRNHKAVEPFSPLVLNPTVPPRELPPVLLNNTLSEIDKHVRMGTRSSSGSYLESPPYNQMNGQGQNPNASKIPNNSETPVITLQEIKQEPIDQDQVYEEDSYYLLEHNLEQSKSRRTRVMYEDDTASNISTASSRASLNYETADEDDELAIIFDGGRKFPMISRQYSGQTASVPVTKNTSPTKDPKNQSFAKSNGVCRS